MNVLVTGCAGFVGWKVTEYLLDAEHAVVGVDNVDDAYDPALKRWRLSQLEGRSNFTFYLADICDRELMNRIFSERRPLDAVVNLAARAGVRPSAQNPWSYFETNVTGTLNLLELCRHHGVAKFVLASSSSLYGENKRPFREDQPTDRPLSPYAASKKAAEALCYTYHHLYGLDVTVLRYFTVYGPAGRPDMSIFRFIRWIAEGEPLAISGDGSQERDFTFVDDIARGTLLALKPLGYEIINLGSDRPASLQQVVAILEMLLDQQVKVVYHPKHPADVPATWADISKARELLGWEPQTSLEEGLRRAVEWYLQNRRWAKEVKLP